METWKDSWLVRDDLESSQLGTSNWFQPLASNEKSCGETAPAYFPMNVNNTVQAMKFSSGDTRFPPTHRKTPELKHGNSNQTKFAVELQTYDKKCYSVSSRPWTYRKEPMTVYTCKVLECNKEFKRVQNLVMHLRVHFNIKNFFWNYCDKSFTQKGNLQKHMKQHTFQKLYERQRVQRGFSQNQFIEKYNLLPHFQKTHCSCTSE